MINRIKIFVKNKKAFFDWLILILSCFFLVIYFTLGIAFVFADEMPFEMNQTSRVLFGILLMSYAVFRAVRLMKD